VEKAGFIFNILCEKEKGVDDDKGDDESGKNVKHR